MGIVKENQKVKLIIHLDNNSVKEIDCTIKEVYEDRLAINFPEDYMDYADYLEEGEELTVKIFTPAGIKILDTIVLDSPYEPEFVIEYTENTTDIQRREFVRVMINLKLVVTRETDRKPIITNTVDASGGGLKFLCDQEFLPDENVSLTIYMPDDRSIQAKGKMIENKHLPPNEKILCFTEIDEKERDRIIKKCFEVQVAQY